MVLGFLARYFEDYFRLILMFFLAWLLAFLISPVADWLQRRLMRLPRAVAVVAVLVPVIVVGAANRRAASWHVAGGRPFIQLAGDAAGPGREPAAVPAATSSTGSPTRASTVDVDRDGSSRSWRTWSALW